MKTLADIISDLHALYENRALIVESDIPYDNVKEKIKDIDEEVQFLLAKLNLLLSDDKDVGTQYKTLFLKYISVFCDKQDARYEYFLDQKGIYIADDYIPYNDIRLDVDNNVPKGWIWEFVNYCFELYSSGKKDKYNYEEWLLKEKNFQIKI